MSRERLAAVVAWAFAGWLGVAAPCAAEPNISGVAVRGLQSGSTSTLVIDGSGLLPDPRLMLPVPIARQAVKPGATPNRVEFEVTLEANVPPGVYPARIASPAGISQAVPVAIDALPQVAFAPEVEALPAALHGNLAGGAVLATSFAGRQGLKFVAEVECRRVGGGASPVLHLRDAGGKELAMSRPTELLFGDTRLEFTLPADGKYTLELHDLQFSGPPPGNFRLRLGELKYADFALPLAVQRGTATPLAFVGNLPPEARAEATLNTPLPFGPAPWPAVPLLGGLQPSLACSPWPEAVETAAAGEIQDLPAAPVGVSGRISAAGQVDRYRVPVTPGSKVRLELIASRICSPLDGVLVVQNDKGGQLARDDDRPGTTDPGLDLQVPADASHLVVAVQDLLGRGGQHYVYRLVVRPVPPADFQVQIDVPGGRITIPQGGRSVLRASVQRQEYTGPIRFSLQPLPPGITLSGAEIPAGRNDCLLALEASGSEAAAPGTAGIVYCSASSGDGSLVRMAQLPEDGLSRVLPWLRSELAVAIGPPAPLAVDWNLAAELPRGSVVASQVSLVRREGADGPVRLSLVSTQAVPPIADGNDKGKPDVQRALRLPGPLQAAAGASGAEVALVVPADLDEQVYDLAIQAELLSADGKQVLATVTSPIRRGRPGNLLQLELSGQTAITAKAGPGPTGMLTGKVTRLGGLTGPVTLAFTGLPQNVPAPTLVVPADQSEFVFEVRFPGNLRPQDVAGQLIASGPPHATVPGLAPTSNAVPVKIKIEK